MSRVVVEGLVWYKPVVHETDKWWLLLLDSRHVKDTLNLTVVFGAFAEFGKQHDHMGVSFIFQPCGCITGNYR